MEELEEMEEDAGLGNGGLGRLAGKKVKGSALSYALQTPLHYNTTPLLLQHNAGSCP